MTNKLKEFFWDILFRLFGIKSKKAGWTSFSPLKIVPEYTVDLEKGHVTGVVKHNQKAYLTVIVDVPNEKTVVKGSLRRIHRHTKPFKKHNYIEIIKDEAEYFIENKITNPKEFSAEEVYEGEAKEYPFEWIKEIDDEHFDSLFKEDDENEFGVANFTFQTVKSENTLNQMSEACFFFAAPSVIVHENYSLSFLDVKPLLLEILMKDFVPHYKNVQQLFVGGEFKEIRFEKLKEESKEIVKNLISANFYPVISDLYRGKYAEKSGPRKLQYFLINKEDIAPLYSKETEKVQQFIQSAYFDQNDPLFCEPVGWRLEQNLKDSITIRSFCTFDKQIVLLVNIVDDSVEAMYIFG